ncbi:type 1 glutamine amidotransferase [Myxococcaceae bacterium GXIMD 01537]
MFGQRLKGVRVAVLAADGVEQVELTSPVRRLKKEGAVVSLLSPKPGAIQAMNHLHSGQKLPVDLSLDEARVADFDALLIPGGLAGPDALRQNEKALRFVKEFDGLSKPIAVICHGPWLLVSANRVRGRKLTSWPGIRDDIKNAGGVWTDEPAVRDHNWVSSRSPLDLRPFEKELVALFSESVPREQRIGVPTERPARLWPRLIVGGLALGTAATLIRARQLSA